MQGIPVYAALTYAPNAEGVKAAFGSAAGKIKMLRMTRDRASLQFDDEDRETQKKAGAKK